MREHLFFDVRVAATSREPERGDAERLAVAQRNVFMASRMAYAIVLLDSPHPDATRLAAYRERTRPSYDIVAADGVTFSPLPALTTEQGREIQRNWLACRVPVVERTQELRSEPNLTGFTARRCARQCADLTWPAIHAELVVPTCGGSRCHEGSDPSGALDWVGGGASSVHARIVGSPAEGLSCGESGLTRIVPGDASASLFYTKTGDEPPCGARMPLAPQRLREEQRCAIGAWIDCGACPEADGGSCARCIASRREACNVRQTSDGVECIAPIDVCDDRVEWNRP
ncbi:MAG: hypothetical protein SangKO_016470 [Sandaracinaceae bacterium]